jgi:hypothetical protein
VDIVKDPKEGINITFYLISINNKSNVKLVIRTRKKKRYMLHFYLISINKSKVKLEKL